MDLVILPHLEYWPLGEEAPSHILSMEMKTLLPSHLLGYYHSPTILWDCLSGMQWVWRDSLMRPLEWQTPCVSPLPLPLSLSPSPPSSEYIALVLASPNALPHPTCVYDLCTCGITGRAYFVSPLPPLSPPLPPAWWSMSHLSPFSLATVLPVVQELSATNISSTEISVSWQVNCISTVYTYVHVVKITHISHYWRTPSQLYHSLCE